MKVIIQTQNIFDDFGKGSINENMIGIANDLGGLERLFTNARANTGRTHLAERIEYSYEIKDVDCFELERLSEKTSWNMIENK